MFGHISISLLSALGYYVYTCNKTYILIIFILAESGDLARKHIGMRFGTRPFAYYVAPEMRLEGAFMSIIAPTFVAMALYEVSHRYQIEMFTSLKLDFNDYVFLGQISGFLALIGYILASFLKRCADINDEHDMRINLKPKRQMFSNLMKDSALISMWNDSYVFDHFFCVIFPVMFAYWYVTTYQS